MAASGFEGFEKRLELHFSRGGGGDLRRLEFPALEKVLHAVQCTVVSAVGNRFFDSYVLSESSLFVYPSRIIIKTCGTTQLLKSLRLFVDLALTLGLTPVRCRYTRGSFIFPDAQPFPHTSFKEEVAFLEENLPKNLSDKKASVLNSNSSSSHRWHVFTACDDGHMVDRDAGDNYYTVEICMTELDRVRAGRFFREPGDGKTGDSAGREMTEATGIRAVNEKAVICDYAFDPCGYSMNGIDGSRYSTVHVTPEEGFSYASFECLFSVHDDREEILEAMKKAVEVFRPAVLSVSTTSAAGSWMEMSAAEVEEFGMRLTSCTVDEFPDVRTVVFQTFDSYRK